jgi:hypothetical protein
VITPKFQAQNPAISGYRYGWASCTAFSGAMAASFDRQVPELLTGGALRNEIGDFVGGLNLAQIDAALTAHQGVNLDVRYGLPWADFAARITAGQGAVLQGWYAPIAVSRFDAGNGFKGNHAIFVPPGWAAMDPLADGRFANVYEYHGEPYPQALLKDFAGKLNIGGGTYRAVGAGLVYAAFTADRVAPPPPATGHYVLTVKAGTRVKIARFTGSCISSWGSYQWGAKDSTAPCRKPVARQVCAGGAATVIYVTKGAFAGKWIHYGTGISVKEV